MKKVIVNSARYYFEYKEKPAGFGTWVFFMGDDTSDVTKALFLTGRYCDVRKLARIKAAELGFNLITLGV